MKREEVKGILPDITDEQLTKIMDLHGADIERQKQTITTLTTERDAAKNQHNPDTNESIKNTFCR